MRIWSLGFGVWDGVGFVILGQCSFGLRDAKATRGFWEIFRMCIPSLTWVAEGFKKELLYELLQGF